MNFCAWITMRCTVALFRNLGNLFLVPEHACKCGRVCTHACMCVHTRVPYSGRTRDCMQTCSSLFLSARCCCRTVMRSACFLSRAAFRCPLGPSPRTITHHRPSLCSCSSSTRYLEKCRAARLDSAAHLCVALRQIKVRYFPYACQSLLYVVACCA